MVGKRQIWLVFALLLTLSAFSFAQAATNATVIVATGCANNINDSIIVSNNVSANSTCFVITGDNLVFDCDGYTITGSATGYGIYASGRKNIVIRNCRVTNFEDAIRFATVTDSLIDNCTLFSNTNNGAHFSYTNTSRINSTNSSDNLGGIVLSNSNWNNITNATTCGYASQSQGVILQDSSNSNIIEDSNASLNYNHGFNIAGDNNTLRNSYAGGNSVAGVQLSYSTEGIVVCNNTLPSNTYGVLIDGSSYPISGALVENNTVSTSSAHGIYLSSAHDNEINSNSVNNSASTGIWLSESNNNAVSNNNATYSTTNGIYLSNSDSNNLTRNDVSNTGHYGVGLEGGSNWNRLYNITGTGIGTNPASPGGDIGIMIYQSDGNYVYDISIQGGGVSGFYTDSNPNGTVGNMNITDFAYGLDIEGGNGAVYDNIRVTNSTTDCGFVWVAQNTVINNSNFDCPAATSGVEIYFYAGYPSSNGTQILNSNITAGSPITSDRASYNLISNNRLLVTSASGTVSLSVPATGGGGGGGGGDASYSNITNNVIICSVGGCTSAGIKIMDDNNLVDNNSIYNFSSGKGILLDNDAQAAYGNNVTNNYVYNCGNGIELNGRAKPNAENNTIDGNTINITSGVGIAIDNSGQYSTITNNAIMSTGLSGIYIDHSSSNSVVSNNQVSGIGMSGIYIDHSSSNSVVSNNQLSDIGMTGIFFDFGSGNALVSDNRIERAKYGIYVGSLALVNNCNITGNNVSNVGGDADYSVGISLYGTGNRADSNRLINTTYGMDFWNGPNTGDSNHIADNNYGARFWDYDATEGISTLSNSSITNSTNYDLVANDGAQGILLNTTFDKNKVEFEAEPDDSDLTVKWYVRAHITMDGAPTEAQVNLTSILGNNTMYENSSASTGLTSYVEFTEYIQNRTTNVTYNNYTAYVNKTYGCAGAIRFNDTQLNLPGSTVWNITLTDRTPIITQVFAKGAEDPASCASTTVGEGRFNVTDLDGACEINPSLSYINYTYGSTTRQAGLCVNESGNETSMTINCTGADMAYWDSPGSWTMNTYVADIYGKIANDTSNSMEYNIGIYLVVNNEPINFGPVAKGTVNNSNINSPGVNLENCGNVVLNDAIEGADISDENQTCSMYVGNFKISDQNTAGGPNELALSYGNQTFQPVGGIPVSTGNPSTWDIFSFVTIPTTQEAATYDKGTWSFHPSQSPG